MQSKVGLMSDRRIRGPTDVAKVADDGTTVFLVFQVPPS